MDPEAHTAEGLRGALLGPTSSGEYQAVASHLNVVPSWQNLLLSPFGYSKTSPSTVDRPGSRLLATPRERLGPGDHRSIASLGGPEIAAKSLSINKVASTGGDLLQEPVKDRELPDEGEKCENALNAREATFNLVNTVVGVGVLSVPYAFRLSGYPTLVLLVIVILVTSHTGKLIGRSLVLAGRDARAEEVPPKGRDYAFMAFVAFGKKGAAIIGVITSLEVWFACITYMVMSGAQATLLFPTITVAQAVVASCALTGAMVFLPIRVFSYLSLISSAALLVAVLAVVGAAFELASWAHPGRSVGAEAEFHWQHIPRSIGLLIFCFAGHPCFPVVHECMRETRSWPKSVDTTFLVALLYYGGIGVFGYLVFGLQLDEQVTENVAAVRHAAVWQSISAAGFMVKILLTAPILLNASFASFYPPPVETEWPWRRALALAVFALATTVVSVSFSEDAFAVASLTGSVFVMITSVLFPAAVERTLMQRLATPKEREAQGGTSDVAYYATLAFGFCFMSIGTVLNLQSMMSAVFS